MVGASVTRIIDSNWSARRGSTARTRASADDTSSTALAGQRLEAGDARRVGVERRLAAVEPAQHLDHPQQRVVADAGHRRVARAALGRRA